MWVSVCSQGMNEAGWGFVSDEQQLTVRYPPGDTSVSYEPAKVIKVGKINSLSIISPQKNFIHHNIKNRCFNIVYEAELCEARSASHIFLRSRKYSEANLRCTGELFLNYVCMFLCGTILCTKV